MPSTFSSKAKREYRYGGRSTAVGVGYEVQVAAVFAVKMLIGDRCIALSGLSGADIAAVTMQAPEAVDDVILTLSGRPEASVFISAKQRANSIPLTQSSRAFVETVTAFVCQFLNLSPDARTRSRLVWVLPSSAGKPASYDLLIALDSHRQDGSTTLSRFLCSRSVRERKAVEAFINQAKRVWKNETGRKPSDHEIRDLLRMVYVAVYEFEFGMQHDHMAESDIRAHIVTEPKHAKRVWEEIKQLLNRADQRGLCLTGSELRTALTAAGIELQSPPDYAKDISHLETLTKRNLSRLRDHTVLRFGTQRTDEVHIKRIEELSALKAAAKAGHMLITGEPGCGKSGLIHPLSVSLQREGFPVVLLLAEEVFGRDWKASANLPDLTHALDEVLANWSTGARGFLITDALDAVRDPETLKMLHRVLQDIKDGQSGWTVVASVREFDLKHGRELRESFPGRGVPGHDSNEFAGVSHFHLTGLTDSQLDGLGGLHSEIQPFIDRARKNPKSGGIHRSPFFLRLAAELLQHGVKPTRLADWNSPAVLLRKFWEARITTEPGSGEREAALQVICGKMNDLRSMSLSTKELSLTGGLRNAIVDLRSRGILRAPILKHGVPVGEEQIRFSHHLLHDYAIARSLIPAISSRFVEFAIREPLLPIFYRQSFLFALEELWDGPEGPLGFWACALKLEGVAQLHGVTRILAPILASRRIDTLADLEPLLNAVKTDGNPDSPSQKALRHLASALEDVEAETVRASLGAWCLLVDDLAGLLSAIPVLENPIVLVIAKLNAICPSADQTDLIALNSAARRVLVHHASKPVSKNWPYAALICIETVCKTFQLAAAESENALNSLLSLDRLRQFPHQDLYTLAQQIKHLGSTGDGIVLQLFRAAFGTGPGPGAWENFGGAVMPLRMQTSDHWNSIHYSLAEYYESSDGTNAGLMTELACITWNAVVSRRRARLNSTEHVLATLQFRGVKCDLIEDLEHACQRIYEHEENRIISHFEKLLRDWAAKPDADRMVAALERLAKCNRRSLLWAVFLEVGSEYPLSLGVLLEELLNESLFLTHADYSYGGTALLGALHRTGDSVRRKRLERLILDLPKKARFLPDEPREPKPEWLIYAQNRLLGALEESNIVLKSVRDLRRARTAAEPFPENRKPEEPRISWSAVSPEEELERRGIRLKETANAELFRLCEKLKGLLPRDNNTFDVAEVERLWPLIGQSERASRRYRKKSPELAESLWGHLVSICDNLATRAEWPAKSNRWKTVRRILLEAAKDPNPKPSKADDSTDNDGLSWGWPAPRIDAARGLPFLVHRLGQTDVAVSRALRKLCRDKSPPLRRNLADRLFILEESSPQVMWELFDLFVTRETLFSVLDALVSSLDHLWSTAPDRVRTCLDKISERAMKSAPVKSNIYQTLAQTNLFQFLRTGDSKCEEFVTNLIEECETQRASTALGKQLHNCRAGGWLIAGNGENVDKDADAARNRTWSFFSRLLTATHGKKQQLQERWRQLKTEPQQEPQTLKAAEEEIQRVTSVVHDLASQLYFASGAFKNPQGKDNERLTAIQLRRFWNESAPLFALLTDEPHPNIAHHIVQTLEHLMPCAPCEVFVLATKSICTSSATGFQYDSLALDAVVKLIQRALADHREIFQDKDSECLEALLKVLDLFVEAGWPQARQLTHRLEEIYR